METMTKLEDQQYQLIATLAIPQLQSMIDNINAIADENDPEVATAYIEAIQVASDNLSRLMGPSQEPNVKHAIRIGHGDFRKIQQHCIELGIV